MNDKSLGAYERHESPDYADGGVAAALIEKEAEEPNAEVRELRSALAREVARGNALQDALDAADPRPLTPDAITDEMVKRGESYMKSRPWTVSGLLRAALTEPPARPEGAEDIEVLLFDAGVDENRAEVANFLAARLTVSPKEDR